jgi:hypothetical protein
MILRHPRIPVVGEIPSSATDAKPCFRLINAHCIASNRKERIAVRMVDRTPWALSSKARVEAKLIFKPAMVVCVEWLVGAVPAVSTKTAIANSSRQRGNQSCLRRLHLRSFLILLAWGWRRWASVALQNMGPSHVFLHFQVDGSLWLSNLASEEGLFSLF